jgi:uridine kinase
MPFEERVKINYDHPKAFDTDLLISHLKDLKAGKSIVHPTYDFAKHLRGEEWVKLDSAKVILVEGILLFENKELVDMMDIKIFVDTDADVRILRRLLRDVKERGRNLDGVVEQYLTTVKPMHERFVEPSKRYADVIVPEGGHNEVAFQMIIDTIKRKIQ